MNAVEIEEAISELAAAPYDAASFPFVFLEAFGNKPAVIAKLKKGASNSSDIEGGVLQRSNIHIATCETGKASETLRALKESPATAKAKAKFILATDGEDFEAEDLVNGETVACSYQDFPNHFGFFLALAGITTVKQIRESSFDIRATSRLNKLYVELLNQNEDWRSAERRPDMNHFMARLIFCFFAEDTDIFHGSHGFTSTIETYSKNNEANTHEVIAELFRAMNTPTNHDGKPDNRYREAANIKSWANGFPYVNGGLFSGSLDVPKFSKIARSYLIHIGNLDWKQINPDIFGSMIQAVADDEERGSLGMHYTSVPNILKVLNPLFLDDLRGKLEEAGDNARKLLNLRNRMAKIRVFDPACGSGNFLVIAYKEMREIEWEINKRRGEEDLSSAIPLTNFRGIEINDFPAEIARLALIIAEYQADVLYRGQRLALNEFLPLDAQNWITCGNALRLDWLSICPPTSKGVKIRGDDLFNTPLEQTAMDFENEGGETYICGNPPYAGKGKKSDTVLEDMARVIGPLSNSFGYIDYAGCWFIKAAHFFEQVDGLAAFVSTNSIAQGQQVPQLWPLVINHGVKIQFASLSFKWSNSALNNAGVICSIIGIGRDSSQNKRIYESDSVKIVEEITPYLTSGKEIYVRRNAKTISLDLPEMETGSVLNDGGNLIISPKEYRELRNKYPKIAKFLRKILGAQEFLRGEERYCFYIEDKDVDEALVYPEISERLTSVAEARRISKKSNTSRVLSKTPHKYEYTSGVNAKKSVIIPTVSSGRRLWLPVGYHHNSLIIAPNYALYDCDEYNIAILSARLHIVWVGAVCGRLKTDYRYSNSLGWNVFPVPPLTEKNKADLTRCAEDILLAREAHFPATIADLYNPDTMPENLRRAHEKNDETLERIYIGRRFKNDTERLEKLFEMYTKMTTKKGAA